MKSYLNDLTRRWAPAGALALLLGACGGGGGEILPTPEPPPAPPVGTVPPSATASPTAYTLFTGSLAPTDTEDPLTLPEADAPTTEVDPPLPVT